MTKNEIGNLYNENRNNKVNELNLISIKGQKDDDKSLFNDKDKDNDIIIFKPIDKKNLKENSYLPNNNIYTPCSPS